MIVVRYFNKMLYIVLFATFLYMLSKIFIVYTESLQCEIMQISLSIMIVNTMQ